MKILCLGLGLILFAMPISAGDLPTGKWSGSYSFAEDDPLQVKYQVDKFGAELEPPVTSWGITMNVAGVAIEFSAIQLTDNQLSFRMNPGEEVACLLTPGEGGVYKGRCGPVSSPDAPQVIKVFMRPPVIDAEDSAPDMDSDEAPPQEDSSGDQPT